MTPDTISVDYAQFVPHEAGDPGLPLPMEKQALETDHLPLAATPLTLFLSPTKFACYDYFFADLKTESDSHS